MLLPVGVVIGCVEIMLNAEADRTEFMVGRRIMNRSHAFWSIGFFSAGLFGAQVASFGISPQLHLALVVPIVGLGSYLALHDYAPSPPRGAEGDHKAPLIVAPTWPILVLVVVTIPAMVLEGASMDWSAIYMRDSFGSDKFWQGIAVASFAVLQGLMRFYADGVVERFSPAALARVLFVALGLGCITVVLSPWPVLSLIGFAAMGLGTSAIFPLAMSAAAQRNDRPSALNIAALAQFSFMIFLIAPPILGFIAHGLRNRPALCADQPCYRRGLGQKGLKPTPSCGLAHLQAKARVTSPLKGQDHGLQQVRQRKIRQGHPAPSGEERQGPRRHWRARNQGTAFGPHESRSLGKGRKESRLALGLTQLCHKPVTSGRHR